MYTYTLILIAVSKFILCLDTYFCKY